MSLILVGVILAFIVGFAFIFSMFSEKETDEQKERVNEIMRENTPKPKKVSKDKYPRIKSDD